MASKEVGAHSTNSRKKTAAMTHMAFGAHDSGVPRKNKSEGPDREKFAEQMSRIQTGRLAKKTNIGVAFGKQNTSSGDVEFDLQLTGDSKMGSTVAKNPR